MRQVLREIRSRYKITLERFWATALSTQNTFRQANISPCEILVNSQKVPFSEGGTVKVGRRVEAIHTKPY